MEDSRDHEMRPRLAVIDEVLTGRETPYARIDIFAAFSRLRLSGKHSEMAHNGIDDLIGDVDTACGGYMTPDAIEVALRGMGTRRRFIRPVIF
jgi:hypothetical protein